VKCEIEILCIPFWQDVFCVLCVAGAKLSLGHKDLTTNSN